MVPPSGFIESDTSRSGFAASTGAAASHVSDLAASIGSAASAPVSGLPSSTVGDGPLIPYLLKPLSLAHVTFVAVSTPPPETRLHPPATTL